MTKIQNPGKGFYSQIPHENREYYTPSYKDVGTWVPSILASMKRIYEEELAAMTPEQRKEKLEKDRIAENNRKLDTARRKVEYDLKYFTPEYEELFPGYICEKQTSYSWVQGSWPNVLREDSHYNCDPSNQDELEKLQNHSRWLRCEYLTTQMLVMESWKRLNETSLSFVNEDFVYMISLETDQKVLLVRHINHPFMVHTNEVLYSGRMKSINEYRKVLQMLNIKL